jgi:hypothetical protein
MFDYRETWSWAALNEDIESWLISMERGHLWAWGLEVFWITFVAAYPNFPRGIWPEISSAVPVEGPFITSWLASRGQDNRDEASLLEDMWVQFRRIVFSVLGAKVGTVT